MKVFDYKLIDDKTIRKVYLKILNKHSGENYITIAHSTFSKPITEGILSDLMTELSLNEAQAKWLLDAHTQSFNSLKRSLLHLDPEVSDIDYYDYLGWAYHIQKQAKQGYVIFGGMFLITFTLLILMTFRFIDHDLLRAVLIMTLLMILSLVGFGSVYLYYRISYQIPQTKTNVMKDISILVSKIKLLEHLVYLPRRGDKGFIQVFALKILYKENNQNKYLIYPILERENILTNHPYRLFSKRSKQIKNELKTINQITVSYDPKSKLILDCDQDLRKLLFKE